MARPRTSPTPGARAPTAPPRPPPLPLPRRRRLPRAMPAAMAMATPAATATETPAATAAAAATSASAPRASAEPCGFPLDAPGLLRQAGDADDHPGGLSQRHVGDIGSERHAVATTQHYVPAPGLASGQPVHHRLGLLLRLQRR